MTFAAAIPMLHPERLVRLPPRDVGLEGLDTDGQYSRPDVFELNVDPRAKDGVKWEIGR